MAGGSQKKPQLSQEQFEMIMSEQEENAAVKRNLMNKQLQLKPSQPSPVKPPEIPKPMSIAEQNNVDI